MENNNNEKREGVVIVSMSNLFHIFDKIRNPEQKKKQKSVPALKNQESKKKAIPKFNSSEEPLKGFNEVKQVNTEQSLKNSSNPNDKNSLDNKNKKENNKKIFDYFTNLVIVLFFILVLNWSFLWILYFILSEQKNKFYCFDPLGKEFRICSKIDFCDHQGITNYIFTDSPSNYSLSEELKNVNQKYTDFFTRESEIFTFLNKKFSRTKRTLNFFKVIIIITKNEKYLYSNTFRTTCESNTQDFILVLSLSMIVGNLLFGYLADIYGRKTILLIILFLQILGGFFLFIFTHLILKKGEKSSDFFYNNDYQMFNFEYNYMSEIVTYMEEISNKYDLTNLNTIYQNQFNSIKFEVLSSTFIRESYKKNKIFIFFCLFLIFSSQSPIKTISIAYIMENALTKDSMSNYFLYINFAFTIGLVITYSLIIILNCFHIPVLIISILQFILFFIVIFRFYESQRFNFEYSYFGKITEFTENYIGKENLRNFYSEKINEHNNKNINSHEKNSFKENENTNNFTIYYSLTSSKIQSELEFERQNLNANIWNTNLKAEKKRKINQFQFSLEKENIIRRQEILYKPVTTINKLMNKEKQIRNHYLIIYSFIISTSIICELIFGKITSVIFISRERLVKNKFNLIFSNIFNLLLTSFISLYPVIHYLVKYFGIRGILFFSLFIILIFSGIYELICSFSREQKNLNIYEFDSIHISYRDHRRGLVVCIFLNLIGAIGLRYCLFFYLTKLTKTIYRCSFYGKCQTLMDITLIISFGINQYIEKNFLYASLFGFIGIINSFFITHNDDSLNITEMKEINFDEVKINNHNN